MSDTRRYFNLIVLTLVAVLAALIGTILTGSFSLASVGMHLLADAVPLAVGFVLAKKRIDGKATDTEEEWLSIGNTGILFFIGLIIAVEAYDRFNHPQPVKNLAIVFAGIDFVLSYLIAHLSKGLRYAHNHLHTYLGQYLHQLADFLASGGVLLGLITLALTGSPVWDACAAFGVVIASWIGALLVFLTLFQDKAKLGSSDCTHHGHHHHH